MIGMRKRFSWKAPEFKPLGPAGALLADLDEDGDLEIIVTAGEGYICAFHHDGRSAYGYPIKVIPYPTQPIIADITGDGRDEILIGDGSYGLCQNLSKALREDSYYSSFQELGVKQLIIQVACYVVFRVYLMWREGSPDLDFHRG